jgi:hypothetical protein
MNLHSAPWQATAGTRARLARAGRAEVLVRAVPVGLATAFVVLLFTGFGALLKALYWNGDDASGPVIAELYGDAPSGARVVLGNVPWYSTLWFELLTRHFPLHRELWEVGPWVAALIGIALLSWSTARAAGRWAGAVVAFVLVCAGPALLSLQFSGVSHGMAVVHVCILDAFLVLLVARRGMIGGRLTHLLVCAAVAAVTAVGAASDALVFPSGLVPFVLAAMVLAFLVPRTAARRIAVTATAIAALSLAGSRVVIAAMDANHIHGAGFPIRFARWDELAPNLRSLARSLASLLNADFGGAAFDARGFLAFACALVLGTGLVVAGRSGRSWTSEVRSRVEAAERDESDLFAVRAAHVSFWLFATTIPAAVYVVSTAGLGGTGRYLVSVAYGIAALVAVAVADRGARQRAAVVLGACVIVSASVVSLAARDLRIDPASEEFASTLLNFAQGEGLAYGYGAYWDAAPLTWLTHGRIQVYPVKSCVSEHGICTFPVHQISSWYTPRPSTRTFLIVDKRYGVDDPGLRLGGRVETLPFGHYTVIVYDYDIASTFAPGKN